MAVAIMIHHTGYYTSKWTFGYLAVEFFFIVAGFMFITQFNEKESTFTFLTNKLKKLFPLFLAVEIIVLVEYAIRNGSLETIEDYAEFIYIAFVNSLGLTITGIPTMAANGVLWFFSAYLVVLTVLHAVTKKVGKEFIIGISIVAGVMSIGYLYIAYGEIAVWKGQFYKYCLLLRAFGDICLGIFSYEIVRRIQSARFTNAGKYLFTFISVAVTLIVIIFMFTLQTAWSCEYIIVFLIFISAILVLSEKSVFCDHYTDRTDVISKKCAYLSILIYVSHYYWMRNVSSIYENSSVEMLFVYSVLLTVVTMVAGHCLSVLFVHLARHVRSKVIEDGQ